MRNFLYKRKMIYIILIIVGIITVTGATYAIFTTTTSQEGTNTIETLKCLELEFSNQNNVIKLANTYAMSDERGSKNTPYTFTLTNNCGTYVEYSIGLAINNNNTLEDKYVKTIFTLANDTGVPVFLTNRVKGEVYNNKNTYIFRTDGLENNASKDYKLVLWIDESATTAQSNKSFLGNIIVNISPSVPKLYGIKRLLTTSSSAWERINDSVGLVANAQVGTTPVKNDFDDIYPWSDIISYNYDVTTKQITAYYGDPAFKFDGSNGDVFTKIPEFYWKRYQDENYEYILISKNDLPDYIKSEEFSVGRYIMSGSSSRVYSRSGYAPLTKNTITDARNNARNLGEGFGQMDWHYFILQMLYLVEYADYNSQSKLGLGYTNASNTAPINSGGCDELGMKSGSKDGTDNTSIIYRGIEDIFGNIWQFVDGINIKDRKAYICYDSNKYAVDTFSGCYKALGYINGSTNGYISKLGYDSSNPMIALPTELLGSSDTNISDNYFQGSGNRIALVGGRWNYTSQAGLWCWNVDNASSNAWSTFGSRLLRNQ